MFLKVKASIKYWLGNRVGKVSFMVKVKNIVSEMTATKYCIVYQKNWIQVKKKAKINITSDEFALWVLFFW